ncbi:M15 family metallopeptidase [Curtobacterium sp. 22159]|uniref:M15 family metallopeptidase n=1 Tax=Curtobacterium sp. 22159 TaxID=3453882 RepID=UPI003F83E081
MHQSRLHVLATLVVAATTLTVAGCAAAAIPGDAPAGDGTTISTGAPDDASSGGTADVGGTAVSGADGYVSDSTAIDQLRGRPAVSRLDPDLRRAVERATEAAAADDVEVRITSGWRSTRYQRALLEEGIRDHGSRAEALRWVSTPERSSHVTGRAVDVGEWDAMAWMQEHGRAYGLCQVYANEAWHYELRTTPGGTCPELLRDSSEG